VAALRLADNKTAELAEWDTPALDAELAELADAGVDMEQFGFGDELAALAGTEGQTDEDAVPEPPPEPVSRRGAVYALGRHRLMCGDSTSAEDFARLMGGERADIAFTSPPYNAGGVAFADGDMFKHAGKKAYADGYQDSRSSEDYIAFASSVLGACFDNCARFIFWNVSYNANSRSEYIAQIVPFLPRLIEQVAWKKTSAVPLRGSMRRAWEPIYIFSVDGEGLPVGEVVTNIWEVSNTGAQGEDHKACFPVALPERGIDASGARSVLDPFCGTGTTIVAAEKKGIRAFGMELDPHYCDVIRRRWAEFVHGEGCDWQTLAPEVAE
jgi:DNA modification methylase